MQNRSIVLGLLFGLFVFGLTNFGSAYADTITATQNGNWNVPSTWAGGVVPIGDDDVIIPGGLTVTITVPAEMTNLDNSGTIIVNEEFIVGDVLTNNGGGILQINPSGVWEHETEIDNSGTITIQPGSEVAWTEDVTVTTSGTINNNGNFLSAAFIETTGTFNNFGTVDNEGTFQNQGGVAQWINHPTGILSNLGFFTNIDTFTNNGIISNDGTITNTGTFTNNNIFTFSCDGIITGTILPPTNQPVLSCSEGPPVFTSFPDDIVASTDPGQDSAIVSYAFPTAADGDDEVFIVMTTGLPSGNPFPVGVTTNTFVVTDGDGETATDSFTVTVNDLEGPVISDTPTNISQDVDSGESFATVSWSPAVTANDAVDGPTSVVVTSAPTSGLSSGSQFPPGTTTVTFTSTDSSGNISTTSFDVTVTDNEGPVIANTPTNISQDVDSGESFATVSWSPAVTANDAIDGPTSVVVTSAPTSGLSSGSEFPFGTTTVTFTSTDSSGNISTTSFDVTVTDNEGPVIANTPTNISQDVDSGESFATVSWSPAVTANDIVDGPTSVVVTSAPTSGLSSGSEFPFGTTTVTFTSTDSSGNISTTSFDVTVTDNEGPVISDTPTNIMTPTDLGESFATVSWSPAVTANDIVDGPTSVVVTSAPTSGLSSGSEFPFGTTTVTFTSTDSSGNISTTSFDVTVSDSEGPMISGMPSDISIPLPLGQSTAQVTWIEPTVTDNVDGTIVPVITSAPTTGLVSGSDFPPGTTTVTYTATDSDGNVTTASFTVTVTSSLFIVTQDGDWDSPSTWNEGSVPSDSDDKLIPSGFIVSNTGSFTNTGNIEIIGTLNNNCGSTITNTGTIIGTVSEILCTPTLISPSDGSLIHEEKPDLTWESTEPLELRPVIFTPNLEDTTNPGVPIELVSLSLTSAEPLNIVLDGNYAWNVFVDIDPSYNPGYPFTVDTVSSSVATYDVSIIDTTPPVITNVPDPIIVVIPTTQLIVQVPWDSPTITDNITPSTHIAVIVSDIPGADFGLGTHLVTYIATDAAGNSSTESFTITVTHDSSNLVNGGYEIGPVIPTGGTLEVFGGATSITTWIVNGDLSNSIDYHDNTFWQVSEGVRNIELSGTPGTINSVSQLFATTPGELYQASFDMAGNPLGGSPVKSLDVSVAGTTHNFTFDTTNTSTTNMGYVSQSFVFTANSNSETITFTGLDLDGFGAVVDNVRVEAFEDTIPPVITLLGNDPETVDINTPYTDAGATATDNVDGDISANILVGGLPIDTSVAGSYIITYDVTDAAGNTATQITRTVNVIGSTDVTLEIPISQSSDDAEEDKSKMDLTSNDLDINEKKYVGLRFQNVEIPVGSTITNAYVQFTTQDSKDTGRAKVKIYAQDSDDAQTFTNAKKDISSRPTTQATVNWKIPNWIGQGSSGAAQQTPDISSLIQEVVDRDQWTDGNSIAIIIKEQYRHDRDAISYDANPSHAPTLHIEFTTGGPVDDTTPPEITGIPSNIVTSVDFGQTSIPVSWSEPTVTDDVDGTITPVITSAPTTGLVSGSDFPLGTTTITYTATDAAGNTSTESFTVTVNPFTTSVTLEIPISQSSDDAEQDRSKMDLPSSDLDLNEKNYVGLRFQNVEIPADSTITNAYVQFTTEDDQDTGYAKVKIYAQDSDDADTFTRSSNNISSRPTTQATVDWTIPNWIGQGSSGAAQQTPDISSLIQEVVDRDQWTDGNSIAIILKERSGNDRDAVSYDSNPNGAATLHIEFTTNVVTPTNLVFNGGFETPIISDHNGDWETFSDNTPGLEWTVVGGPIELQHEILGGSFEGQQHAELDSTNSVTISQTLNTVSGDTYDLSFAYKARPNTSSATNGMEVTWNGNVIAPGITLTDSWQTITVQVIGTGSDTLAFSDVGVSDSFGTFLDDVVVITSN